MLTKLIRNVVDKAHISIRPVVSSKNGSLVEHSRSQLHTNDSTTMEPRQASTHWQAYLKNLDRKQVEFFHSEKLIKVDDNDQIIGPISKGESHSIHTVRNHVYHRALSLLVFDEDNRFLLTQRSDTKITFPNYFTNACCSHPLYNDQELEDDGQAIGAKRATIRRSHFELGTELDDIKPDELNFVNRIAYRAPSDCGQWAEAEIDYIFILKKNLSLKLNNDEVQSYRYVTREDMKNLLSSNNQNGVSITPWMKLLARDHLFKYWDNLNNLQAISQIDRIIDYRDTFSV